jgi:hypothetical protein
VVVMEDGQWRISMMETLRGMLDSAAQKAPPTPSTAEQPASPR